MDIQANLKEVIAELPTNVRLVAVSKFHPAEAIEAAYSAGQRIFGESKEQELSGKHEQLPKDIEWHFIGHLQTNKVKYIAPYIAMIHAADSYKLLVEINKQAAKHERTIPCLLEIHIAQEESKYGFMLEEVEDAIMTIKDFPHVHIKGLMTIAPFVENPEENRGIFKKLFEFAVDIDKKNIDNVTMDVLSMGMTGDYEVAVEEGATMVRVGTGIFGVR